MSIVVMELERASRFTSSQSSLPQNITIVVPKFQAYCVLGTKQGPLQAIFFFFSYSQLWKEESFISSA